MLKKIIMVLLSTVCFTGESCITTQEVQNSNSLFSYQNKVYDITGYSHPGGKSSLKKAIGIDIESMIVKSYSFHLKKNSFKQDLESIYKDDLCLTTSSSTLPSTTTLSSPSSTTTLSSPSSTTTLSSPSSTLPSTTTLSSPSSTTTLSSPSSTLPSTLPSTYSIPKRCQTITYPTITTPYISVNTSHTKTTPYISVNTTHTKTTPYISMNTTQTISVNTTHTTIKTTTPRVKSNAESELKYGCMLSYIILSVILFIF